MAENERDNNEEQQISYDQREEGQSNIRNVITKIIYPKTPESPTPTLIIPVFNVHKFVEKRKYEWENKYEKIDTPLDVFFLEFVPDLCIVNGLETETYRRIRILARNEDKCDTELRKQIKEITEHIDIATINWRQISTFGMDTSGNEAHTDDTYEMIIKKEFEWLRDVYFQDHIIQVNPTKKEVE